MADAFEVLAGGDAAYARIRENPQKHAGQGVNDETLPAGTYDAVLSAVWEPRALLRGRDGAEMVVINTSFEVESGPYKGRRAVRSWFLVPSDDASIARAVLDLDKLGIGRPPTLARIVEALTQAKRIARAKIETEVQEFERRDGTPGRKAVVSSLAKPEPAAARSPAAEEPF